MTARQLGAKLRFVSDDYIWQRSYQNALTETDPSLLREHIKKARDAMGKRLGTLAIRKHPTAMDEYRAIQDADVQLKILERQVR
jgi:hypothetical protein